MGLPALSPTTLQYISLTVIHRNHQSQPTETRVSEIVLRVPRVVWWMAGWLSGLTRASTAQHQMLICVLLDLAEKNGHYNIKNHIWQQQIEEEVVVDGGGWWALTLHSTYPDADESCRLYFR